MSAAGSTAWIMPEPCPVGRPASYIPGKKIGQPGDKAPARKPQRPDPNITQLEQDLAGKLGANVKLTHSSKGTGKLVISYNNLEELDGILEHIR